MSHSEGDEDLDNEKTQGNENLKQVNPDSNKSDTEANVTKTTENSSKEEDMKVNDSIQSSTGTIYLQRSN